ncbi:ABC transporter permease [Streptomyces actinomycinicus]|uniref:ABC transporter permease n=1 Tax=Streptomyces actinomycinicus TaxID=1695166 RepID=A0A937EIB1_9ACTN|nr:ABC transporter permease [Streptomyces actinomycinicus]MBL1083617.1 ABC transporter permease [Streptomyces actinomycinicus]
MVIAAVALPIVITLAVMAFAWPAGRISPRDVPVGIVGTGPASQHAVEGLTRAKPGAFDFHLYADQQAARSAIRNRDVYGALAISGHSITVLKATAASPSVAQLLTDVGQHLADKTTQQIAEQAARQKAAGAHAPAKAHKQAAAQRGAAQQKAAQQGAARQGGAGADSSVKILVKAVDVVPVAAEDPRGVVFSSTVFPLTICGILIGAFVAMARGLARPRHRVLTLLVACAVAALGVYLVAQGFLGALPHNHVATWGILSLDLLSVGATAAGVIRLLGPAGLGLSAAVMVFVGNAFSGATSAPEMLPKGVDHIGQWLPPGAGASLLRDTTYFDGNSAAGHLAVLALWSVCGLTAVMCGHWVTGKGRGTKTGATASKELLPAVPGSGEALSVPRHAHAHAHARRHDGDG